MGQVARPSGWPIIFHHVSTSEQGYAHHYESSLHPIRRPFHNHIRPPNPPLVLVCLVGNESNSRIYYLTTSSLDGFGQTIK
jgi:hypothetical protein